MEGEEPPHMGAVRDFNAKQSNRTLDVSARPDTGRATREARPAPVRSARQRDR